MGGSHRRKGRSASTVEDTLKLIQEDQQNNLRTGGGTMTVIRKDVIAIIKEEGEMVCRDCVEDDEWVREEDYEVILKSELEEGALYFCDRGRHRIR